MDKLLDMILGILLLFLTFLAVITWAGASEATALDAPPPGVVLQDDYFAGGKDGEAGKTVSPDPDPICWVLDKPFSDQRPRWAFEKPGPDWRPAHLNQVCRFEPPTIRITYGTPIERPRYPVYVAPKPESSPWWEGLSSPATIPRGRESEGMPDDFMPQGFRAWWNPARTWRYE